MSYVPEGEEEPPQIRRLRVLVMVMMVVLMLGIVTIAATIVIRLGFGGEPSAQKLTAEAIALPSGAEITALGHGSDGVLVTIRRSDGTEALRLHDAATGDLVEETLIVRE
ncbi:MAG: DUF6476 family protein [Pseudomonadota bacterium]